jgi:hypothetical protein
MDPMYLSLDIFKLRINKGIGPKIFFIIKLTPEIFRKYDGATLECRASNNNVSQAQSRILEIRINRK